MFGSPVVSLWGFQVLGFQVLGFLIFKSWDSSFESLVFGPWSWASSLGFRFTSPWVQGSGLLGSGSGLRSWVSGLRSWALSLQDQVWGPRSEV